MSEDRLTNLLAEAFESLAGAVAHIRERTASEEIDAAVLASFIGQAFIAVSLADGEWDRVKGAKSTERSDA